MFDIIWIFYFVFIYIIFLNVFFGIVFYIVLFMDVILVVFFGVVLKGLVVVSYILLFVFVWGRICKIEGFCVIYLMVVFEFIIIYRIG